MTVRPKMLVVIFFGALALSRGVAAETLEQIVSREDVLFNCPAAVITVGRDGMVYLVSAGHDVAFALRMTRDGKEKFGGRIVYAVNNATANAAGVVASANAHFAHQITIYDRSLKQTADVKDFLVSDAVGWDAPGHAEAGESGDFYGLDQHRDRILRVTPEGKRVRDFTMPHQPQGGQGLLLDFRVSEKAQAFWALSREGVISCVGFDGQVRWKCPARPWSAFDVDDDGVLHALEGNSDTVKKFSATGEAIEGLKLNLGAARPAPGTAWFGWLRAHDGDLILRRQHPTELFQRYDLKTGELRQTVSIDHERLTVTFPASVWTAGQAMPFDIKFETGGEAIRPAWRVWARPYEAAAYRELPLKDGQLQVPADCEGLYVVKVTPETQPWQKGAESEYIVRAFVEVRKPGSKGTVTVMTPDSRVFYARGEAIPFSVMLRSKEAGLEVPVDVRLTDGARTVAGWAFKVNAGGAPVGATLPSTLTTALVPGDYVLAVSAPDCTGVNQRLRIGMGSSFQAGYLLRIQYGDYGTLYPSAGPWDAPDVVAACAARRDALGMNLIVDRIGCHLQVGDVAWANHLRGPMDALYKRLSDDPAATAPDKVRTASPLLQTMAAYGARGIREMAILLYNDAGLPLGTGYDGRKPEQMTEAIRRVTEAMKPYPAFRGWSWASNWWVFEKRGSKAAATPEEAKAYDEALKRARETGAWDPVLDTVAGRKLGYAVEAEELFNKTMREVNQDLVTAAAAPYRNVDAYPPVTLNKVDEVDLHIQWEQMGVPYHAPHNVDFYKRPGKLAWGHPEIWNDDGRGDQILPTLFMMIMRGADGVGCSGDIPPWGRHLDDPRSSHNGTASVFRSLNRVLRQYGPWLTSLDKDDRVAIVASGRMFRIDDWCGASMGVHFARVLEAYITCLHAHRPARIVFAEDMKPDSLKKFDAVLIVGQRVEFEPAVAEALRAAKEAGRAVFYDGTCREELVKDFTPLGVSFDKIEKDPSTAGDDDAYWRFPAYARENLPAFLKAVGPVVRPVAEVANDEVMLSSRVAGKGRVVFVVNNTVPQLEPGHLWRVNLCVANRVPLVAPVKLDAAGGVVYDVLALREVKPKDGVVQADLRSVPARIFAILPKRIERLELYGGRFLRTDKNIGVFWFLRVLDGDQKPIETNVPLLVRLLGPDGRELWRVSTRTDSGFLTWPTPAGPVPQYGGGGEFVLSPNAAAEEQVVEATELFSGITASLRLKVEWGGQVQVYSAHAQARPVAPAETATGKKPGNTVTPAADEFGPHVRDVALCDGGRLAVFNTMNWDHNLYALDTKNGRVRWRQRVGHYFAFAPQAVSDGLAVQGFDFLSAEGYHLYLADEDGKLERRFALYGLPKRLPHRFVPGILHDRINNFAVPEDASWVASAGDLGLAVWDRAGKLLWSEDWWKDARREALLAAADAQTLLVVEGMNVTARRARDGGVLWKKNLAETGEVLKAVFSADRKTCALLTTTKGGRVFVLRGGEIVRTFPAGGSDLALNADGSLAALTSENTLRLYSMKDGMQWSFAGDDWLRFPRFSPDGRRIVTTSDLGSLYVLDLTGRTLFERDMGARAVPAWLPGGDLLLATWMGDVCRLDDRYKEGWRVKLAPQTPDMTGHLLDADGAPTVRIAAWSNAAKDAAPLAPNLLSDVPTRIEFVPSGSWGGRAELALDPALLHDGKADAPPKPWVNWNYVGFFAETSPFNYLLIDTWRTQLRVTGVTFYEDPAHPESWLRDAQFQYWDGAAEKWTPVQPLLSNAAVHTHVFERPVEAARFRIVLPWGLCGNLRLGEVVFHGEKLGNSHPDAAAKRPLAVLFDEQQDIQDALISGNRGLSFRFTDAQSGGRCLELRADACVVPAYRAPFGHTIPNWDFEIAENPAPGQYRYLQFAWRALAPQTRGVTLHVGGEPGALASVYAGEMSKPDGWASTPVKVAEAVPREWTVVRLDLWDVFKKPVRVQQIGFGCVGGPAAFDAVLLGKTEKNLPEAAAAGGAKQ